MLLYVCTSKDGRSTIRRVKCMCAVVYRIGALKARMWRARERRGRENGLA